LSKTKIKKINNNAARRIFATQKPRFSFQFLKSRKRLSAGFPFQSLALSSGAASG
jgi:hypothetical protein